MVDPTVVELCTECLLGAVVCEESRDELRLTATALTRELIDTHGHAAAVELLEAANRGAVTRLDSSDLDAGSFTRALRCLALLHERVESGLAVAETALPRPDGSRSSP